MDSEKYRPFLAQLSSFKMNILCFFFAQTIGDCFGTGVVVESWCSCMLLLKFTFCIMFCWSLFLLSMISTIYSLRNGWYVKDVLKHDSYHMVFNYTSLYWGITSNQTVISFLASLKKVDKLPNLTKLKRIDPLHMTSHTQTAPSLKSNEDVSLARLNRDMQTGPFRNQRL